MAGELEKFLQQAAERLAERVNQGQPQRQRRAQPAPAEPPRTIRQAERAPPEPEIVDALVIQQQREAGLDPLSNIDTRHLKTYKPDRRELAYEIGLADERMAGHVQHVTQGDVVHLRKASEALSGAADDSGRTEVRRRQHDVSPLVQMLRNPDTLRAAFLAGQIFTRKF